MMARCREGLLGMAMLGLLTAAAQPALAQPTSVRLAPRSTLAWTITSADYLARSLSGEGEIAADGSFDVGPYGSIKLAGLTLENACLVIEQFLRQHLSEPQVRLQLTSAPPIRLEGPSAPPPLAARQAAAPFAHRQFNASPLAQGQPVYPPAPRTAVPSRQPAMPIYRQTITVPPPAEVLSPAESMPLGMQPVQATEIIMAPPPQEIEPPTWPDAELTGPMSVESRWRPMGRSVPTPVMQLQAGTEPPTELNYPRKLQPEAVPQPVVIAHFPPAPRENAMVTLPPYIIAPPDILQVESTQQLRDQPIRGQHLVRPDGTIGLGIYGSVYVAGMTLDDARIAIADQVGKRVKDVDARNIAVDVLAYNSKFYYVITDGGGYGEQVTRLPITGNETVLDAIGQINGLPAVASKKNIWVARATAGHEQILPVDWNSIAQRGATATNYQILPGDRVYVRAQKIIRADTALAKFLSPFERILGITLLGSTTVNQIQGRGNGFGGGR